MDRKLSIRAFALTCAIMWGFLVFAVTWWLILFEGATGNTYFIGKVYRGYCVSPWGSVIGLAWGFFDGLIFGAVFAWLYNRLGGCRIA